MVRGFWGDIVNSPYWAFGLDCNCCEDCAGILNKVASTDRVHHEGDISEFNLTRMLIRMETFREYHFPPEKDRMIAIRKYWAGEEIKEVEEKKEIEEQKNQGFLLPGFDKFQVKIVPVAETVTALAGKRKFQGIFDRVIIGGGANIKEIDAFVALGKETCIYTIENVRQVLYRNVIVLKAEEKEEVLKKIKEITENAGLVEISSSKNYMHMTRNHLIQGQ